jgi:3-deoxy-manno-octulosonate cytidylyltransferase (CMP-KDO synthetase)
MRIACVIPARGGSTRFPNKPLADICGKPMVQWVWEHCSEVTLFERILVATDSDEIASSVKKFGGEFILTPKCETATERLYQVSCSVEADIYVMVNGDEPMILGKDIVKCIPDELPSDGFYVSNLMTKFKDPVQVVDPTNLKVVTNKNGECLFISRSPIPFPKGSMDFEYNKFVGVAAYSKKALDFYHNTEKGEIEIIEENDSFRFIENGIKCIYINADCSSISVDTPKDLDAVSKVLGRNSV